MTSSLYLPALSPTLTASSVSLYHCGFLPMFPATFLGNWARKSADALLSLISFIVFLLLDCLDYILCRVYGALDSFFEREASSCYCIHGREVTAYADGCAGKGEGEMSESLFRRESVFRDTGFPEFGTKQGCFGPEKRVVNRNVCNGGSPVRWSDCGCEACVSWMSNKQQNLHVVVKEPSRAISDDAKAPENVIVLHGFLSSSSLWTELVFQNLSKSGAANYRLFAVDLLGFGKSPKPRDCLYTLRDHVEMIEKSVISPFQLDSFHIVAHSMGCIVAVALASKHKTIMKSVTLAAPPYFSTPKGGDASLTALTRLAEKRIWPPLQFGSSVMSWYEHLGRCVCFVICRNHRIWERLLKFITRRRDLHFAIVDLTRHTHHSAWHTMHNVICGGMKQMDGYLDTLRRSQAKISIVHGDRDQVVPLECSIGIKARVPDSEVTITRGADHCSIMYGREREFARFLERVWDSTSEIKNKIVV